MTEAKAKTRKQGPATVPAGLPDGADFKVPSPENVRSAGGSGCYPFDMLLIERTAMTSVTTMIEPAHDITKKATAVALRAFKPTDAVEGMIAAQAVALHNAAMECSRRAMFQNQPADIASKLRKDAANSARAMVDMVDALARYRGKGPQVVRVERVVVNEGGQAVVGNVTAGTPLPASASSPQTIRQGEAPMSMVEAAPVQAGKGEGA